MSERSLSVGMQGEVQAPVLRPVVFLEGEFVSAGIPVFVRLWSGYGTKDWDSKTWTGAGHLLAITPIQESIDVEATGFTISLSGQASANISIALQSCRQGKPCKIWLGALDASGAVISSPYLARQGRLDVPGIDDSGEECTVSITYEDRLVDLQRPRARRYTSGDQQIDYPNDLGFDFVPGLQDSVDVWGKLG